MCREYCHSKEYHDADYSRCNGRVQCAIERNRRRHETSTWKKWSSWKPVNRWRGTMISRWQYYKPVTIIKPSIFPTIHQWTFICDFVCDTNLITQFIFTLFSSKQFNYLISKRVYHYQFNGVHLTVPFFHRKEIQMVKILMNFSEYWNFFCLFALIFIDTGINDCYCK